MVRRWLIRGFFLALLLLWVAGWAVSTCYVGWGGYFRGGKGLTGGVGPGGVGFGWAHGVPAADGWDGALAPQPFRLMLPDFWWERASFADTRSTKFTISVAELSYEQGSLSQAPAPPYVWYQVGVPFWFLLVVSGAALWWAWRKTRPQPSPATAFPVETTGGQT